MSSQRGAGHRRSKIIVRGGGGVCTVQLIFSTSVECSLNVKEKERIGGNVGQKRVVLTVTENEEVIPQEWLPLQH